MAERNNILDNLTINLRRNRYEIANASGVRQIYPDKDYVGILAVNNVVKVQYKFFKPKNQHIATLWLNNPAREASPNIHWHLDLYNRKYAPSLAEIIYPSALFNGASLKIEFVDHKQRQELTDDDIYNSLEKLISDEEIKYHKGRYSNKDRVISIANYLISAGYEIANISGIKLDNIEEVDEDYISILKSKHGHYRSSYIATLWFDNPKRKAGMDNRWCLESYRSNDFPRLREKIAKLATSINIELLTVFRQQKAEATRLEAFGSDYNAAMRRLLEVEFKQT